MRPGRGKDDASHLGPMHTPMPATYSIKTINWETNVMVRLLLKYRFS